MEKDAEWSKALDEAKNETPPLVQECHGAFVSGKEELFEKNPEFIKKYLDFLKAQYDFYGSYFPSKEVFRQNAPVKMERQAQTDMDNLNKRFMDTVNLKDNHDWMNKENSNYCH